MTIYFWDGSEMSCKTIEFNVDYTSIFTDGGQRVDTNSVFRIVANPQSNAERERLVSRRKEKQ